ncbi:Carboxy-terminal processing protease CtpB precursor [Rubripirellula lacrimiformis]|uniref:Carboxy-terminal processing protease CtpB n=1 Tax=Rubripirellula lacrimiformis TaxID=1930273 RepID=A0A517N3D6_9BACT|nr:S41 family peptidase [Rubripirellula lacrimiformis]QDT01649.1 Carboxy-terminal processing protease CtpB precursor [Rubripirellula lacrimiformis]
MPPRNLNIIIIAAAISLLCYATHRRARPAMIVGDALNLIDSYYVDPVDSEALLIAAMNGMTSTLDENSEYIPGAAYESFQDNINQEFAGIGIYVEATEDGGPVRVRTPLVGSPALKAGFLPGDLIVKVDGEDVSKMPLPDVSNRLRGPVGTTVKITVRRPERTTETNTDTAAVAEPDADADNTVDDNTVDDDQVADNQVAEVPYEEKLLTVTRARIELESVAGDYRDEHDHWVFRLREDPTIGYIRLTSFGEKSTDEMKRALAQLDNNFRGLVLDLRGNGGGLLHTAADISDMFLNAGNIVTTRTRGGVIESRFDAEPGTLVDPKKPFAILIDGNSASASEIVSACMQDNHRAIVVGTRSYGKGTVQNILPLQFGRSALRLTVARYYRPSGANIHRTQDATDDDEWGVTPDDGMIVELDEESLIKVARRWTEAAYPALAVEMMSESDDSTVSTSTMIDPQLRRAVETLKTQIEETTPESEAA